MDAEATNNGRSIPLWQALSLGLLGAAWCVIRLCGLEHSPPGFTPDEALAGLHAQCLGQTGHAADGKPWPLFAAGLGGGLFTPAYMASLVAWTRVFGTSIGSVRAMGSAYCLLAIIGLWFLARHLCDTKTAWLVALAAALSPWSFVLSRLGADAPVVAAFLVWGTFFFLRSPKPVSAALGGFFFALAAYSYPPTRLHAPLLVLLLLLVQRKHLTKARLLAFLGTGFVLSLPLAKLILDGTLTGRSRFLSILSPDYIAAHRGELPPPVFVVKQVFENLHEHLRPSYLFFTGDPNIRHSTQRIGELGWLDTFAVGIALCALVMLIRRAIWRSEGTLVDNTLPLWRIAALTVVVGAFATLPAALCWEGLPHAYRSIGAYPAVALFTGVCWSAVWNRWRWVPVVALVLAAGQTAMFFPDYFGGYAERSADAFDASLRRVAESGNKEVFDRLAKRYPELAYRYYLVQNFGYTCDASEIEARRISAQP